MESFGVLVFGSCSGFSQLPNWFSAGAVYVTAIAARRDSDGAPLGRHHLVSLFMHGVRFRGLHALVSVPSWDLSIVLEGLSELPFELLE